MPKKDIILAEMRLIQAAREFVGCFDGTPGEVDCEDIGIQLTIKIKLPMATDIMNLQVNVEEPTENLPELEADR